MQTIAIVSQKGGSGKTTTAINLAVAAHQDDKNVLIIDLDLQASAYAWHQARKTAQSDPLPHVQPTHPAALKGVLEAAAGQGIDLVLIDTAAKTESDTLVAIEAADLVLIPCRPSAMDLRAIMNTVRLCRTRGITPHVVLTQIEPQGTATDETRASLAELGIDVLSTAIGRRSAFLHSITDGRGVSEYEPRGKAAQEIRALFELLQAPKLKHSNKKTRKHSDSVTA